MSAAPELGPIFEVIQGGLEVGKDAVTEVIADNGAKIVDITTHEAYAGNGTTSSVAEVVNIAEGASTGTTEGVALLTQSIQGVAVPAIAVALGTVAGVSLGNFLYDLSPEFWADLNNSLENAGLTVKGKLVGFMDNTGKTSYPESAVNIIKNALLAQGAFTQPAVKPDYSTAKLPVYGGAGTPTYQNIVNNHNFFKKTNIAGAGNVQPSITTEGATVYQTGIFIKTGNKKGYSQALYSTAPFSGTFLYQGQPWGTITATEYSYTDGSHYYVWTYGQGVSYPYYYPDTNMVELTNEDIGGEYSSFNMTQFMWWLTGMLIQYNPQNPIIDEGATLPTGDPVHTTYPSWVTNPFPSGLPSLPVGQPNPNGNQQSQQSGANTAQDQIDGLEDLFYLPDPPTIPDIIPDPDITPIPPDPIPVPDPVPPDPIPPDPNPIPSDSDIPPIIPTPDTSSSSKLFTVYNPSASALNGVGAFLWSSSIMDTIKKIWQNPLDGIISLHKIYTAPTTGGSQNIILGYLDTEVTAPVVTSQFVEVDCGSVTVSENKKNATDYSPFTQLQIYLPFVGIQELDTNEIMGGSINVKYKVDVYTGTCLAMIFVTRSPDKTSAQLLYTFSGNCSQKLPLTSSEFSGAISALLGIVGVGVASGGALGAIAGAGAIAHSLTQDMVHIQHSGGLSANSGILAPRKPFLIIARQYGYDANNYADIYGFPANMTVTLRNCKDFVRVKAVNYKGKGTQEEKQMIVDQLKRGVIV